MFASSRVRLSWAETAPVPGTANENTAVVLIFGVVLFLVLGLPLSAETVKSSKVSPKPPAAEKLAPEKTEAAATAQNGSSDPADCVRPAVGDNSKADGELKNNESTLRSQTNASSADPEVGAKPNSEMISDKLKLSLEPKTDQASDLQAPQCGREEGGAQAKEKENGDAAPN